MIEASPYPTRGLVLLKGETHLHTVHSDGLATPAEMFAACRERGYDFAAITDHNTVSGQAEARASAAALGMVCLSGVEVTTFHGHAVCLGLRQTPEWRDLETRGMDALAADVHRSGGVLCVCHPIRLGSPQCSGCTWEWPIAPPAVDLWEVFSAPTPERPFPELAALAWRRLLARGGRAAPVAAGDVHSVAAALADRAATYVYATAATEEAVLEGLRAGRTIASWGLRLDVWLEDGSNLVLVAETGSAGSGCWTPRHARDGGTGKERVKLRRLRVGDPAAAAEVLPWDRPLNPDAGPACLYAEAFDAEDRLVAISAPIWIP